MKTFATSSDFARRQMRRQNILTDALIISALVFSFAIAARMDYLMFFSK